jgi:protoporphyrinogen oxidase
VEFQNLLDLRKGLQVEELTFEWQKEDKNNDKFRSLLENGIEVDYDELISTIKTSKLNNLSKEDNDRLFYSTSIEEIVFYIMKGLNND